MIATKQELEGALRREIKTRLDGLIEQVALGHVDTIELYRNRTGQIFAYREVLEMLDAANKPDEAKGN